MTRFPFLLANYSLIIPETTQKAYCLSNDGMGSTQEKCFFADPYMMCCEMTK